MNPAPASGSASSGDGSAPGGPVRVYAFSDLHVDHPENRAKIEAIPKTRHRADVLLLAGDVTDHLETLRRTLETFLERFGAVFFVPGNHELWVNRGECDDSLQKFHLVMDLCAELGVHTRPAKIGAGEGRAGAWIVPLFSWYTKPEQGRDSLFIEKLGEDPSLRMWADEACVRWPEFEGRDHAARWFLRLNAEHVAAERDAPVISFSHFLPRTDLMFRSPAEIERGDGGVPDRHPSFNFSRVAGSSGIEDQLRRMGSMVHVYGHQHRNRYREIDGVLYVSHCLGYPGEYGDRHTAAADRPRLVWSE